MEQNTWENLCEDTYKQVWLSCTLCAVQQEANAVSLGQELYWCIDWCLIQFWLHYFGCTVICID